MNRVIGGFGDELTKLAISKKLLLALGAPLGAYYYGKSKRDKEFIRPKTAKGGAATVDKPLLEGLLSEHM